MSKCPMPNYQWLITKATFFDLAVSKSHFLNRNKNQTKQTNKQKTNSLKKAD